MKTTFLSPAELAPHQNDPNWRVIDCRFDLAKPGWGREDYARAHIPGAVFADLNLELSSPITPATGRHPLPDPEAFIELMCRLGISNQTQVVVVDTAAGAFAARLWWMLSCWFEHPSVAVLEGGFTRWQHEGYPVASGSETPPHGNFSRNPQSNCYVTAAEVNALRHNTQYRLIDARSPERYRGESEPIDRLAGHIPGAVNRPHTQNLARGGLLEQPETLRQQFLDLLAGLPASQAIVYCGSGVTSCLHLVTMQHIGLPGSRLYVGSWSEWIGDPKRPIAIGSDPG